MFEHYIDHHAPDPRRRLRLAIATNLAVFGTAGALAFTWLMGKLQIAQVAPPSATHVLLQMSLDGLPPPPPPPAAPPAPRQPEPRDDTPEEPDETPPEDFDEVLPPPKPRVAAKVPSSAPSSVIGTSPFPGVPGVGLGPPGVPGLPPGIRPPGGVAQRATDTGKERKIVPFSAVRAQAIYTPEPAQAKLLATRTGMFNKGSGENETSFCIDAGGRTTDVRTVKAFPGDPGVDDICRETVKTWRFKPFLVEGKAVKTCAVQTFRIVFK